MSERSTAATEAAGAGETDDDRSARDTAGGRATELNVPAIVALAALVGAFWVVAGWPGLIGGVATAAGWYALGPPYAVALGHVALVVCVPAAIDPTSFVIVEAGFVALVLASAPRTAATVPIRYAATALASAGALAGLARLALGPAGQPLWVAAAVMVAAVAGSMYGLHRYGLVVVLERGATDRGESHRRTTDESTTVCTTDGEPSLSDETTPDTDTER
ncbi:hypothetical protein [Natrinema versiforme]|uniref:DUF8163 domain-containing protein n=1 Tax=Natrinema versiforme TaxID=88724 RepID=A0A4V1G0C7_9EURY|nr:hypothetical protein [Natrinema versiforme]QCS44886.1 hypothetical protein FEJ81_21605 [Natrinema versiforme]